MFRVLSVFLVVSVLGCNVSDDPVVANPNNQNNPNNECDSPDGCAPDCAGVLGGDAVEDNCGVCDNDPTNDCVQDCAGVWGGDAVEDNCGVCDDDPTNDCSADCAGVEGGDAVEDMCGVCDDDPTNDCVQDCAGEWGGDAMEDMCGVCDSDPTNDCVQDCSGSYGGEAELDACGRCVGGDTGRVACPTATLSAVADAHVISTQPTANYGGAEELIVDRETTETYLKFDLNSLPADIVIRSLTIRLTAISSMSYGGNGDTNVYFSSNDSWSETALTYETKPAFSDFILASWNVAGLTPDEDTVVEVVDDPELIETFQGQVWGDRVVTLRIASPGYRSTYHSIQALDADKAPKIDVAYQVLSKVDLAAVADTTISESAPDTNLGANPTLEVVPPWNGAPRSDVLVKFDLSPVPANVNIQRVALQMLAYQGFAFGGNGNVYTHLVDDDSWSETDVTYNSAPSWQADDVGFWWLWYNNQPSDKWGINASEKLVAPTRDAYTTDKLISFRLGSSGYRTLYRSREHAEESQRPRLTVYFTGD